MNERIDERPVVIEYEGERMLGILARVASRGRPAVLIAVGGPQYRVGSHRQFTLLARALARAGLTSLRFDYRGMGDSEGRMRSFDEVGSDLRVAIDRLVALAPDASGVVIWGLCDAASSALLYAHSDPRVRGLVLLNPWVRTAEGHTRALFKQYYAQRLIDPRLWRQALQGQLNWRRALSGVLGSAKVLLQGSAHSVAATVEPGIASGNAGGSALPAAMATGLGCFDGPVLFILSGKDLTAQEFRDLADSSPRWRSLLVNKRVSRRDLADANHTFSTQRWRRSVEEWTIDWMMTLCELNPYQRPVFLGDCEEALNVDCRDTASSGP